MRRAALALLVLLTAAPLLPAQPSSTGVSTRRVMISLSFSGETVFLFGTAPAGTDAIVAVMEGPSGGPVRLMEKGRVALFWLGVRQFRLSGVPGVYLVNASCSICNGLAACTHELDLAALNSALGRSGFLVGPEAVLARSHVECLSGELDAGELPGVVTGYWDLQASRGLFAVHRNAIRMNAEGVFYHTFDVPTQAPEGKYIIRTCFLSRGRLLGVEQNELFVRQGGFVSWISRLAAQDAAWYGVLTVFIAVSAGWVAGALFKRGGGH